MWLESLPRRKFLSLLGGTTAFGLLGSLRAAAKFPQWRMYRCSVRGRRASQAMKSWCANLRFANYGTALIRSRQRPDGRVRIVKLDVSMDEYFRLFVSRRSRAVDLRQL